MALPWASLVVSAPIWLVYYGKHAWGYAIAAYNGVGLPLLLLQLLTDNALEHRFGLGLVHRIRCVLVLGGLCTMTVAIPAAATQTKSFYGFIGIAAGIGVLVALAYGWIYKLASLFSPRCSASLLAGNGFAALVLLAITLGDSYPPPSWPPEHIDSHDLGFIWNFYGIAGGVSTIGLACLLALTVSKPFSKNVSPATMSPGHMPSSFTNIQDEHSVPSVPFDTGRARSSSALSADSFASANSSYRVTFRDQVQGETRPLVESQAEPASVASLTASIWPSLL
eukprot:gene4700-4883_t